MSEPEHAILLEKIANIHATVNRIEGWLSEINGRTIKHGRLIAIHSSLLALIGATVAIIFSKIQISF